MLMETKVCTSCRFTLPVTYFSKHKDVRYTSGYHIFSQCKDCIAERSRLWNAKNRKECLALLGGNHPQCANCGYDSDARALEFDHIDNDAYVDRANGKKSGKNYLWKEIKANPHRFQILCANCNRIKAIEFFIQMSEAQRAARLELVLSS